MPTAERLGESSEKLGIRYWEIREKVDSLIKSVVKREILLNRNNEIGPEETRFDGFLFDTLPPDGKQCAALVLENRRHKLWVLAGENFEVAGSFISCKGDSTGKYEYVFWWNKLGAVKYQSCDGIGGDVWSCDTLTFLRQIKHGQTMHKNAIVRAKDFDEFISLVGWVYLSLEHKVRVAEMLLKALENSSIREKSQK